MPAAEEFRESLLVFISTPAYAILIGAEILFSHYRKQTSYTLRGTVENIYLMLCNMGLDILLRSFYIVFFNYLFTYRFVEWGDTGWLYWVCLLLAQDLMFWILHFADHYCRLFWAVHVTHHSSEEFNLTVGFRSSVFQPLYRFLFFIPLCFLGFRGIDIMFMYSATQIYGILIHTTHIGKLGPLEYFLSTPSNHRVHHGSNIPYLDKNMGMVFIFWDRLFGTYAEEREEVRYGLTENLDSHNPVNVIFHEWRSIWKDVRNAPGLKNKFMYIFGPPGWSHDGHKKTSKQLRKEYLEKSN
jgi:sterol desaturase/sphingolipid hydroxylase (fatty acid hydroxylase superfamily)